MGWLSQGFWIYLILQDKNLFCAFEAGDTVCWLVNPPIAKLDLFNSADCRWICKTYAEYRYRNSATVHRLVQSLTLQSTICCCWPSDLRGSIRVSPAWLLSPASSEAGNELLGWTATKWRFVTDQNCVEEERWVSTVSAIVPKLSFCKLTRIIGL